MSSNKVIRSLIRQLDVILFKLWQFRFTFGYKMWGTDYQVRRINRAPSRYLVAILQQLGAKIDSTVTLKTGLTFDNIEAGLTHLHIAKNTYIGPGVFIDLAAPVNIDAEVVLAPQAMLLTHGDVGDRFLARLIERSEGPITLKKGCWIGARAIILPGVTVGIGAVVGAGAIVTAEVADYTVVAGIPAREIRKLVP